MSEDIDHASANAILALQLQDVEDLKRLYAGQEQTDQIVALKAYQAELERGAATCRDHHVATMFGESPLPDEQLPESPPAPRTIPIFGMVERPALPDHHVTNNLNDTQQGDIQQESPQSVEPSQEGTPDEVGGGQPWLPRIFGGARRASNVRDTTDSSPIVRADVRLLSVFPSRLWDRTSSVGVDSDVHSIAETTQSTGLIGKGKLGGTPEFTGACIICDDELPQEGILRLSCGDEYCHVCLVDLFNSAMRDESLFPPRCCEEIPLSIVQHLLPPDFISIFRMRKVELDTPSRTYCANSVCSEFIQPGDIDGDTASCSDCWMQTCIICKQHAHEGSCPEDPAVVSLMNLAAREGFKQCPSCKTMVEITFGCNHMM
ncbi:MAG: hypothetical protein Q9172_002219 [Xanthocarpia lactea]